MRGFVVYCPTESIIDEVASMMKEWGGVDQAAARIAKRRTERGAEVCLALEKGMILQGPLEYHETEEGRQNWALYYYNNDLKEQLLRDGWLKE